MLGSIGMGELLIIFVIALIVFGPRKLPELGRTLGKSLGEFKRASNDLRNTLEQEIHVEERTRREPPTPARVPAPSVEDPPRDAASTEPHAPGQEAPAPSVEDPPRDAASTEPHAPAQKAPAPSVEDPPRDAASTDPHAPAQKAPAPSVEEDPQHDSASSV